MCLHKMQRCCCSLDLASSLRLHFCVALSTACFPFSYCRLSRLTVKRIPYRPFSPTAEKRERHISSGLQLQLHSNLLFLMSEYIRVHIHEFLSPHNSCKLERGPSKRPALTTCPISYNRAAIMHAITNSAFQICSSAPRGIPHRSWLFSSTK